MPPRLNEATEKRTFAVLVDNEPGVLARVVGLFSARGYNIESLTVAETDTAAHASRITIVTSGTPLILEQIRAQLERMVSIRDVHDVSSDPLGIERELALLKVRASGEQRAEALRLAETFRANVIDAAHQIVIFELTDASARIDEFIGLMAPLGLTEISRTGVLSITRGAD
jgi:acetolactate synthase-1/3 small subunit